MTATALPLNAATNRTSPAAPWPLERRLFFVLAAVALIYAFLAGLRTVSDYDVGWQMASGRWIVQHHHIPSVDVFSYTAQGNPWIYPVGAGLVFYAAYLLGGYALISWIGAAGCVGTVAFLLRRGTTVSAGIAILAIPLIAFRTTPRADMFTVALFAAFLSLLWENYETGCARLWWLPVLMVLWANLHPGFIAGLGLMAVYVALELLETPFGEARRRGALHRLRRASGWLVCSAAITLVNPWGWAIYRAIIRQEQVSAQHHFWIAEWMGVRLSWGAISTALALRQTRGAIYLLLTIAIIAAAVALLRAQIGAAIVLLGATYPAVHYLRMGAVFACVVVVIGSAVLSAALPRLAKLIRPARTRSTLAVTAVMLLTLLAALRCFDLVTNRHYFQGTLEETFGAGLGSWFPQQAAEFIEREQLSGEIFNTYAEGGYLDWKLGPQRRVYIDGRAIPFGLPLLERHDELLKSSPDSDIWEQEVRRYNINTVILPLARNDGIQLVRLQDFCSSKRWRPVYLDETSAVFVRRSPQTEGLIQRFPVDCATAPLPAKPPLAASRAAAFDSWANAALVLAVLGRNSEALGAYDRALSIYPDSAFLRWNRADALFAMGRLSESEGEYLTAVRLEPGATTWAALAQSYRKRGRVPAAIEATKHVVQFSFRPYSTLANLGYFYLDVGQPANALQAFDEAVRNAPRNIREEDNGDFDFMVAQGRSGAWQTLGNLDRAVSFQEEAARCLPNAGPPLLRLAQLYRLQGRSEDAIRAQQRAAIVERGQGH